MSYTATETYNKLTANGKAVMALVGDWKGSFFDEGLRPHSGAWGEVLASEAQVTKTAKGMGGVLAALNKAGLWHVTPAEQGDDSDWWSLTELGVEVAKIAAAAVAPAEAPKKVCKKDPTHGEHRVTKSGSYCYACDRIVAERQKAERAAAKAASK